MKNAILFILSIMPINGICTTIQSIREVSLLQQNNKVDLSGNFPQTRTRSLFEPILLMQYSEYLGVNFFQNLGEIIIEIKDDRNNIVYYNIIDTNIESEYRISLLGYRKGNYHIVFINLQSFRMYGNFVIQE